MELLNRSEIGELLERHGITPSRAMGQNFLCDPFMVQKIVRLAGVEEGDSVIEIGPGLGSLTLGLVEAGASVTAIELDKYLVPVLRQVVEGLDVTVIEADATEVDWDPIFGDREWRVVANLPYNIAAPLVLDTLASEPRLTSWTVMVQKEVGERLAAGPGSKAYGIPSVLRAYWAACFGFAALPPLGRRHPRTVFAVGGEHSPHHWLHSYLTACMENGRRPPADLSAFVPWQMSQERKEQLAKPMPATDPPNPGALQPNAAAMKRYCGRDFTELQLEQIRELIAEDPNRARADLSRLTCQALAWFKVDGGLKEMSCRVAMLRMAEDGLISLPPPRRKLAKHKIRLTSQSDPQPAVTQPVHALASVQLCPVAHREHSRLWNEYIDRYHYLGYQPLPGAQLRYFVTIDQQIVAALGCGAAAWRIAPRDQFIGWSHQQRQRHLPLIVNNARFLILPWVDSKNPASKILAMLARWQTECADQR